MKKEKKVWALTLLAFWLLSPKIIQAQQDSVRTLDEVVISATRQEQMLIEVPRSVTVIGRNTIDNTAYNSVGEILASQAGIYLMGATQTPGTNQSVFMRGANSNQVVVLIDGMRVTDPSSPNGTMDFSEISLAGIERIEILRGSHSTVYGGSAIGGVINIITKAGKTVGFHGTGSLQGGTFGNGSATGTGNLDVSYKFKNGFYLNAGTYTQHVRGLNSTVDTVSSDVYKTADKDGFRKTDISGKIGYANKGWDVFVAARRAHQFADIDDRAFDDDDNATLEFNRKLLEYRLAYKLSDRWSFIVNGSWSPAVRESINDSSIVDYNGNYDATVSTARYNGKSITHEATINYRNKSVGVVFGGGQYRETMDFTTFYYSNAFGFPYESRTDFEHSASKTNYAFVQGVLDINKLKVTAGTRLSNHSLFGNHWTFEVSPSYTFTNATVYGSVSSGYNAPSLYQLYDPSFNADPEFTRGNKNLKPESSLSFEVGMKKEYDNGSYLTVSAFRTVSEDNIEYVYLWNKETPQSELSYADYITDRYINLARQVSQGVEVAGHITYGKFYGHGNLSWSNGDVEINPSDIRMSETGGHHVQLYNYGPFVNDEVKVKSLVRRPLLTGYAEVGFRPSKKATFNVSLRHAGSRNDVEYDAGLGPYGALAQNKMKRYNLVDVGGNYRFNEMFSITLRIENILDEKYSEIYGFQTRGRGGYMKLNFTW